MSELYVKNIAHVHGGEKRPGLTVEQPNLVSRRFLLEQIYRRFDVNFPVRTSASVFTLLFG